MGIESMSQLNWLLELYFSDYNSRKYGTLRDIAKDIANGNSYLRKTLSCLEKEGIFNTKEHEFKGQEMRVFTLSRKDYLKFLLSLDISEKYWMIFQHNKDSFSDIDNFYPKERRKELMKTIKSLDEKRKILNIFK